MKEETILKIIISLFFIFLGVYITLLYQNFIDERKIDGLYYSGYNEIEKITYEEDKKGDWVCVNVAYDMPIDRAYDVCVHECSHKAFSEIFAERCEKDVNKCREFLR